MSSAPHRAVPIPDAPTAGLRCRIDTPRGLVTAAAGRIVVAGVAVAETGGAVRVEVRLDGGPWQPAAPDPDGAGRRWLRWQAELAVRPGHHRIHARACDPLAAAAGRTAGPMPGWSVREFVVT
jgi:hypothetical protein